MSVNLVRIAGQTIVKAVHRRAISLGTLDRRLKEVVAMAAESVLIGASAKRAAVLGHLPDAGATKDEAMCFVGTLLRQGAIAFQTIKQNRAAPENKTSHTRLPTHAIRDRHGEEDPRPVSGSRAVGELMGRIAEGAAQIAWQRLDASVQRHAPLQQHLTEFRIARARGAEKV